MHSRRIKLAAAILTLGVVCAAPALGAEGGDTEARFPVRKQVKFGFINQTGEMVISPQFDRAEGFSEGKAAVKVGDKWGFIDRSGKVVIRPQFTYAHSFSEGLAWVDLGEDKYALIDGMGETIRVFQAKYYIFHDFQGGLARVAFRDTKGLRHGFIDRTGNFAIPCQFREAADFGPASIELHANVKLGINAGGRLSDPGRGLK